jgi:hypothetical protein
MRTKATAWTCGALALGSSLLSRAPAASAIDPSRAVGGTVGHGGAFAISDHVGPQRNGRVRALPTRIGAHLQRSVGKGTIRAAPLVTAEGTVLVGAGGEIVELDGKSLEPVRRATVATNASIVSLALLADGTRVALTDRTQLVGVAASGAVRFRVEAKASSADTRLHALMPLPDGGFALSGAESIEVFDATGASIDRWKVSGSPPVMAVRSNGDLVVVDGAGDAWAWRPGRAAIRLGSMGKSGVGSEAPCLGGPVIDGEREARAGERRERIVCSQSDRVVALDVRGGVRSTVVTSATVLRTTPAIGAHGMLVSGTDGGGLIGMTSAGGEVAIEGIGGASTKPATTPTPTPSPYPYGPFPGGYPTPPAFGRDVTPWASPLVADDDSVAFVTSMGVALGGPGRPLREVEGCGGARVAGLAPMPDGALIYACDGAVHRIDDERATAAH